MAGRNYKPEFKAKVVAEARKDEKSYTQIGIEYGKKSPISANTIRRWVEDDDQAMERQQTNQDQPPAEDQQPPQTMNLEEALQKIEELQEENKALQISHKAEMQEVKDDCKKKVQKMQDECERRLQSSQNFYEKKIKDLNAEIGEFYMKQKNDGPPLAS